MSIMIMNLYVTLISFYYSFQSTTALIPPILLCAVLSISFAMCLLNNNSNLLFLWIQERPYQYLHQLYSSKYNLEAEEKSSKAKLELLERYDARLWIINTNKSGNLIILSFIRNNTVPSGSSWNSCPNSDSDHTSVSAEMKKVFRSLSIHFSRWLFWNHFHLTPFHCYST